MPLMRCTVKGKPGFKWGRNGKCYTYKAGDKKSMARARQKAVAQAYAIWINQGGKNRLGDFSKYLKSG